MPYIKCKKSQTPKTMQGLGVGKWSPAKGHKGTYLGLLEIFYILSVVVITTAECVCENTETI